METPLPTSDNPTPFVRNPTIFANTVDSDLVMLDEQAGLYFGLNSVAHTIWQLLATPKNYQELVNDLVAQYEVSVERCQQDIQKFLAHMLQHHLIRYAD